MIDSKIHRKGKKKKRLTLEQKIKKEGGGGKLNGRKNIEFKGP